MTVLPKDRLPLTTSPGERAARRRATAVVVVMIALLALLLLMPLIRAVSRGFTHDGKASVYWFGRILTNQILLSEMLNSVLLACTTTAIALLLAVPLAMIRSSVRFRGQGVLSVLILLPLILPPFVGAMSMSRLLAHYGVLNQILARVGILSNAAAGPDWLGGGFAGVAALQALHLFPILYLNASAALANIDPAYAQAARNLGAGRWRTFRSVTLPLMRPGLFAGGTIVFIWALTDIGTPLILGYERLTAVTLFKELARAEINPRTYSLVFVMLTGAVTLYVLGKFVFGRSVRLDSSKATVAVEAPRLGVVGTAWAWLAFGGVIGLAILPHIGVVLTAISARWVNTILPSQITFDHLRFVLVRPETRVCIMNSLRYAGASTAVDVVIGSIIAWLLVRTRARGRTLLDSTAMLPLAVPGLILAAGYVAITARGSWLESIGPMNNPFVILVIAYSVRRLPFIVRGVSAGLEQIPIALEEASRNLGASRPATVLRITLPLIAASVLAATVLTFSFAMLEVSDSLILAQTESHYPITKEIYRQATSGNRDAASVAAALGVYGMVLLGGSMALAGALLGRRLGAIFRA
ncbi:hypothetical protein LCGC14_0204340 [marine sediment metagenome]|uniref:ABC transmembrane type-1 domain-containing protein n=1 Tax=marine sediment metagenome TaxID=412755 RepID=A0A0F9UI46_9ZZZZ|nr:iron ABC transporter permease [Phycisphaerae bacterium]HDZ44622.1 iron ABC transporter permease [Phycisphaerae bacterium]